MINEHFGRRSIPPRTALDVLREQTKGGLNSDRSSQNRPGQNPGGFNIANHVYEKPNKPLIVPWAERITWDVESHEDYGTQGNLLVILQFSGIEFTDTPVFKKNKADYGTDSAVFYSPINHDGKGALLILATQGDIFESQIVRKKKDDNPFFREEIHLPQLTATYDPTSMSVYEKNHLVIVDYNRL